MRTASTYGHDSSSHAGADGRLFDHLGGGPIALEQTRVIASEGVTHLRYRVVRDD
jgi:hypothetical protein